MSAMPMISIDELFIDYQSLPEYSGIKLTDVNQKSLFGDHPINIAATRGSIAEMTLLVEHGACVDEAGEHGYTPLHNAVEQGHLDAVVWLLKSGARKDARNSSDQTPAELAHVLGEEEIANFLTAT